MPCNMTGRAVNGELLRQYGQILREAQTKLDRIPTFDIDQPQPCAYAMTDANVSAEEIALFKQIEELNREAITAILKMRRLITNTIVKVGL
jgi:hypothetical protein